MGIAAPRPLFVDLTSKLVGASTLPERRHPAVRLPGGGCGQPRIEPTYERRPGEEPPRRLRLYLEAVACPGDAGRHIGG